MGRLLLLFVIVPAVELALLIEIGSRIGTLATLGLIVVTGIVGASLARQQGLSVLQRVQGEMAGGRLPAEAMLDGAIILVAGALLLTPGILTDIVGFLCLVPVTRTLLKRNLRHRLERAVRSGRVTVTTAADFDVFTQGRPPASPRTGPPRPRPDGSPDVIPPRLPGDPGSSDREG